MPVTSGTEGPTTIVSAPMAGNYSFTGLAENINYVVEVNENDPDLKTYFNNKYGDPAAYQITTDNPILSRT